MLYNEQPDAIIVTFAQQMIKHHGGIKKFLTYFLKCMEDPENIWVHRSRGKPRFDIDLVYIIISGRIKYRVYFGGYSKEPVTLTRTDGKVWRVIWPHFNLAGPIVEAPEKIYMKGFQGFRYTKKLF